MDMHTLTFRFALTRELGPGESPVRGARFRALHGNLRRTSASALIAALLCVLPACHAVADNVDETNARPGPQAAAGEARLPADVPQDWWSQVQKSIAASEYHVTRQETTGLPGVEAAWQAPNRAHDLRTYFTDAGPRVVRRSESEPSWVWGLELTRFWIWDFGFSHEGREATIPAVQEVAANGNRIEYRRGDLVEWYVNDPKGLEQGFTITSPPVRGSAFRRLESGSPAKAGTTNLCIDLAVRGDLIPALMPDGETIEFLTEGGVGVIHYGHLKACDATGKELPGALRLVSENPSIRDPKSKTQNPKCIVRIVIDANDATFPITIDPLATSANWTAESNQAGALYGYSVSTAGDVDGDGYSDVIVGAYGYTNGEAAEGRAFLYAGSASGLSTTPTWTGESNQVAAFFGISVATAGDVNGDGYSDVIVGSNGRAYIFHGSASGLSTAEPWIPQGGQSGSFFGYPVATAGDVNGDGYSDVMISAREYTNGQTREGRVYVYHGSASGLPTTPTWSAESNQDIALFGYSISTAGDVNADGYSDVIIGAYYYDNTLANQGRAYVYLGSASGLATSPTWTADGALANAYFGYSVGTAGDINGDGYSDVVVGAYGYTNGQAAEGAAYVYYGNASGVMASPSWSREGGRDGEHLGTSVMTAGDVNSDGYGDVILGAEGSGVPEGAAYVFEGSASGLGASPDWSVQSAQFDARLGISVATAGDVNGDGCSDVIVGAYQYDNGEINEGRAYVYHGSASDPPTTANWMVEGDQWYARLGWCVADAGDVNGDGYGDVITGTDIFTNGHDDEGRALLYLGSATGLTTPPAWTVEGNQQWAELGRTVASAGDVNGDGYSDVIVGVPYYYDGSTYWGAAYVYYGSVSGPPTSPSVAIIGPQADTEFGHCVATAGDVNGDGYSDVIVTDPFYTDGESEEGRAYVYLGSPSGLATSPSWTAESNVADALFGWSAATAGDVNADGFSDVIVGAVNLTNGEDWEGRAYVYLGGSSGLQASPAWTFESNQTRAYLGCSVATAGDVNGDGFSDVVIGAYRYNTVVNDDGLVLVFHGSATGLSTSPDWTVYSDQVNPHFGRSVATAGDINGDGYSDVIVGAQFYTFYNGPQIANGHAFLYLGGASGLSVSPDWIGYATDTGGLYGRSVSSAGDVNGDGFNDIVIGAYFWYDNEPDEGAIYVYHGGDSGLSLPTQQRRDDDSAPIDHLGISDSPDSFRLEKLARTPFGRGKVKLEWEVKPFGTPFDGTGTTQTAGWTDTGTTGALFNVLASGLTTGTLYHWRVRQLYHPATTPFQQSSRWVTIPRNGWQEADLRTSGTRPVVSSIVRAGPSPTNAASVDFTVTFSEAVSGVDTTDFDLTTSGPTGTTVTLVAAGTSTYTVTVNTGSGDGTIRLDLVDDDSITNGGGTPLGGGGPVNGNYTAGEAYTIDRTSPTVAMASAALDPTNTSPILVTVTFSEPVTGFDISDVTPSSATVSGFAGSGANYSFNLAPLGQGLVTADIAAGVCTDVAGNTNTAAAQFTRTVDTVAPTVSMASVAPDPTNGSPIPVTVTFSEPVTGFDATDITPSSATVGGFSGSGASYSFNLTPTAQGLVTADIAGGVCTDLAGNTNAAAAQFSRTFDSVGPTVSMASVAPNPTNTSPIPVTVSFSEPVTGFDVTDITPSSATVGGFAGSGANYSFNLTPTAQGLVTADIAGGVAQDGVGNGNTAAAQFSRTFDTVGPTVAMASVAPDPTNTSPIAVTVTFSEPVTGFDASDITPSSATVGGFAGSGADYDFDLTPTGQGLVSADIPGGVAQDLAGNGNTAAAQFSRTFDSVAPTVTVEQAAGQDDPTSVTPIVFDVLFSETVTGFDETDVTMGGTATGTTFSVTGAGDTYAVNVTAVGGDGTLVPTIGAGAAQDAAANLNEASTSMDNSVTYDSTTPTVVSVVRSDPNPTSATMVAFLVEFSEDVSGVDLSDFDLTTTGPTGTTVTLVSAGTSTYSVTVATGTGDGEIRLDVVDDDSIVDSAGNPLGGVGPANGDFTGGEIYTIDKTAPTVAMASVAPDPTNVSPIAVMVTFSEPVTGFDAADITPSSATVSGFSGSGASYSFNLSPTGQGLVAADIAGGVAQDAAGNGNAAAAQFSRTYDSVGPTVSMSSAAPNPTNTSPIPVTVTFSEPVTGFDATDIAPSNATVSGFAGSGDSYTFNLVPSGQGLVAADIAGGVAQDAAGNGNTAAAQFSRTYDTVGPTVSMSSAAPNPTNTSPIPVTVTFSEPVTDFDGSDITPGNATVGGFAGSGANYSFNLTPSGQGLVTADIAGGAAQDAAGNGNTAAAQFSRTFDNVAPTVSMSSAIPDPTNVSPIPVTVTFSEPVTGFDGSDLSFSNAIVVNFTGSGASYSFYLWPVTQGLVTVDIAGGVAQDAAGNGNTAAPQFSRTYDTVAPTVSMSSAAPDPTNTSPVAVTVTFSEAVSGFDASDVTPGNGTVASFAGSATTYTFDLSPAGQGLVTADIAAGVAQDDAGNTNTAAAQFSRTFDSIGPTVTVDQATGQDDPTSITPVVFDVLFSESVTGFDEADVNMGGTATGVAFNVAGASDTYTINVTAVGGDGTLVPTLAAGAAQDAAGNPSEPSTSTDNTVEFDSTTPTVISSVCADPNPTNGTTVTFTVTFSEAVTGVDLTDFDLTTTGVTGSTVTAVTVWPTTCSVTVHTGTGDGEIRLDVIDDDSIVDDAANPLGGVGAGNGSFTTGEIYIIDRSSPTLAAIRLRDDDGLNSPSIGFTNGRTVDVELLGVAGDPAEMWLSETSDFTSGGWVAYQSPTSYTFETAVEEVKTVYVMLRDAVDNRTGETGDVLTSITLDTTAPRLDDQATTPVGYTAPWIDVTYSEPVVYGVLDPSNYNIQASTPTTVLTVTHQSGNTYRLVTSSQGVDDPHLLIVTNVSDRAGNPIDPTGNTASWLGVPVEVSRFRLD